MIRNIIYLDEPKFFSLSSQVFEGLTEFLVQEKNLTTEATETQKGPVASGRALADAIKSSETSTEKRVLHDHAFAIFEKELVQTHGLADIDENTPKGDVEKLVETGSFIRVRSPAAIVDAARLRTIFEKFNDLGEALAYVTGSGSMLTSLAKASGKPESQVPKQKLVAAIQEAAKANGLFHDPKFLESLNLLTTFGFSDQLELQQSLNETIFSCCLRRPFLREPEDLIARKYARRTERDFVVLGVIAQRAKSPPVPPASKSDASMKEAIANMVNLVAALETSLAGKSSNEIVIDPIAVYVPL